MHRKIHSWISSKLKCPFFIKWKILSFTFVGSKIYDPDPSLGWDHLVYFILRFDFLGFFKKNSHISAPKAYIKIILVTFGVLISNCKFNIMCHNKNSSNFSF